MKREGRQRGMVRTNQIVPSPWNPRPEPRSVNKLGSPPTAGLFTKVSTKPTNHSKFTGKCGRPKCRDCHVHPATKSKDKAKGAQKLKSSADVVSNCKLITWRVVDSSPGLKLSRFSATDLLNHLAKSDYSDYDHEADYFVNDDTGGFVDQLYDARISSNNVEIEEVDDDGVEDYDDDDDDDGMSFCEVGFVCEHVDGDEGWCMVDEI